MTVNALQASQAYLQASEQADRATRGQGPAPSATAAPSFGEVLSQTAERTTQSLAQAETLANAAPAGEAALVDVVTAISTAELSLEAAIAVRNRVIEAYQEIMRMPI